MGCASMCFEVTMSFENMGANWTNPNLDLTLGIQINFFKVILQNLLDDFHKLCDGQIACPKCYGPGFLEDLAFLYCLLGALLN